MAETQDADAPLTTTAAIGSVVESLLFVAGRPLELADLRKLLGVDDDALRAAVAELGASYTRDGRGLRLQQSGALVQLVSAPENARFVAALLGMPTHARLTTPALETLAIIAYRQPISRAQLESIRGVNSDRALATLLQHGLVMEVGRAATVGRPILFGTTLDFLQQFGLSGIDALPAVILPEEDAHAAATEAIRRAVDAQGTRQLTLPTQHENEA
ncbi:MAG: SMC-Scp complex subunit ScpB [Ktedonobacterales bacterium]|nr:SMC-Scp complex subunit ScpB [Ktedonobacterales bacterium]